MVYEWPLRRNFWKNGGPQQGCWSRSKPKFKSWPKECGISWWVRWPKSSTTSYKHYMHVMIKRFLEIGAQIIYIYIHYYTFYIQWIKLIHKKISRHKNKIHHLGSTINYVNCFLNILTTLLLYPFPFWDIIMQENYY